MYQKKAKKDDLIVAYKALFATKAFRTAKDDEELKQQKLVAKKETHHVAKGEGSSTVVEKKVKVDINYFTKTTIKAGDQSTFARKGDTVEIYYTGKLDDGTVFDTNAPAAGAKGGAAAAKPDDKKKADDKKKDEKPAPVDKKAPGKALPLKVQVGKGKVVRGFDEALQQISKGEKAKIVIPAEFGYGKKGKPDAKIPPNANLTFEVEVINIY